VVALFQTSSIRDVHHRAGGRDHLTAVVEHDAAAVAQPANLAVRLDDAKLESELGALLDRRFNGGLNAVPIVGVNP
jgi:hypothetical protein